MANNGYLVNGVCSTNSYPLLYSLTCGKVPGASFLVRYTDPNEANILTMSCYSRSGTTNTYLTTVPAPVLSPNCEIPGPPLTEIEQIEAINGLFPHAVAILAIAWGLRYIRVLVAEWLKERNASD